MRAQRTHCDERDEATIRPCSMHRCTMQAIEYAQRPRVRYAVICVHAMTTRMRSRRTATPPTESDARSMHPQRWTKRDEGTLLQYASLYDAAIEYVQPPCIRYELNRVHTMATHPRSRRAATPPTEPDARSTHPLRSARRDDET